MSAGWFHSEDSPWLAGGRLLPGSSRGLSSVHTHSWGLCVSTFPLLIREGQSHPSDLTLVSSHLRRRCLQIQSHSKFLRVRTSPGIWGDAVVPLARAAGDGVLPGRVSQAPARVLLAAGEEAPLCTLGTSHAFPSSCPQGHAPLAALSKPVLVWCYN